MPLPEGLHVGFIAGTLGQGGAEKQLYYMMRVLKGMGVEATAFTLTREEYWEGRLIDEGLQVVYIGESASRLTRLVTVIRALRSAGCNIVQSGHFFANIYAAMAGRILGIPSIGAVRSNVYKEAQQLGRIFGRSSIRWPDALAANSLAALETLRGMNIPEKRLYYLPNIIDAQRYSLRRRTDDGVFRAIFVGRLYPEKRPEFFLHILAALEHRYRGKIHGEIYGDGPLRSGLESLAADMKISNLIHFKGSVPPGPHIYEQADVLLLTSTHEGTPNVIMEAMACGVPVIASAVGGVPEQLDGSGGIAVPPGDLDAFITAVCNFAGDPALRDRVRHRSREKVLHRHTDEALREKLLLLYSTLPGTA